ncbi:plant UBX domain-containing protein 1-like [Rosa rugosa]|uniref:plant UBX domain-containing protein 1-like n=1 Tax=Rosa rugosa TaxID=74645 RepID=UPI002B4017B6|nr:plant UBX domain-containing protein 1-like [Rosa rugosa]
MTDVSSTLSFERRRLPANLDRIKAHIFEASAFSSNYQEAEDDEIFEFTAEDYYRVLNSRKMRGAEEQVACRSRITKAMIRVRCPDNDETLLEASFHPSEKIQSLLDLLNKVVARPFQIYTTPPKKLIRDMAQDFYSAGFVPGAIVYLSYQ